jgi:uncharacterized protein with HEPN domain
MKSPQPYFQLILSALAHIEQYCPPDKDIFLAQSMTQDAILMRLQEIGENLARLRQMDAEAFNVIADNSWHKLIGLRNIISHGYHLIDPEQIWQIVTEELPDFAATISAQPKQ